MKHYEYVVVGAGPAGIQAGYFLEQAGSDYIVLEATGIPGSFFATYPKHRTLISLNKCYNWFTEPDFNLRYDWNSLLTNDNSMRFTEYTQELYPHADVIVKYMEDFVRTFGIKIQYDTRVTWIDRETEGDKNFILTDQAGNQYSAKCLLMATGTVKPNVPEGIEGIELAEGYENHDIDTKRFINKRILLMGHGNTAFEIANHLSGWAATIHMYTSGKFIKHAWQSHFVGDVRSINNTFAELGHVKMPHIISGARVTKIAKQEDGTLRVNYEEDVPHWKVPGTMHSVGVYDYVIRATGWKYFDPSIFAPAVRPVADAKSKYPVIDHIWESTVPDMFFIGAAMANGDRRATAGFIHGFRYNVRALFHLLRERYDGVQLPSRTLPVDTVEGLEALTQALLTRISTTSAMFQMFAVLGDVVTFENGQATWYPELPLQHALHRPEFALHANLLTLTLDLGFDKFPKDIDPLSFIHPNDPAGEGRCTAFIHPVWRHYQEGKLVNEVHMQSGVFVRYDAPNEEFALEFNKARPHNLLFNMLNSITHVTDEVLPTDMFSGDREIGQFRPWTPEETYFVPGLPVCKVVQPETMMEAAKHN